ncbi:class I SAM-dependent methyltransferase [Clostridiaceae bacterium M8S5]|nr:class I SAM-dependent methyltransferase [Clostridiaceae bacterium M8S5]
MKIVQKIVSDLSSYIKDKRTIEIACGDSDFSYSASKYAKEVLATDISLKRLENNIKDIPCNFKYAQMDATKLDIENSSYDVSFCYNALGHLQDVLEDVVSQMKRITAINGYLLFIASWKIDKNIIPEVNEIVSKHKDLTVQEYKSNHKYHALVIKKVSI